MAKVIVTLTQDWREIARRAGGDPDLIMFDPPPSELEVPDVTQAALDAALADYTVNQAAIDAANRATRNTERKTKSKNRLSEDVLFNVFLEQMVEELNDIRASVTGLRPIDINAVRVQINLKIDVAP